MRESPMTPEGELKMRIRKLLEERGAFWSNVSGGAYSKPGDPDIVACFLGFYLAIEAKANSGRQSEIQKVRQAEITGAEGWYVLARSEEDVVKALDDIQRHHDNLYILGEDGI